MKQIIPMLRDYNAELSCNERSRVADTLDKILELAQYHPAADACDEIVRLIEAQGPWLVTVEGCVRNNDRGVEFNAECRGEAQWLCDKLNSLEEQ